MAEDKPFYINALDYSARVRGRAIEFLVNGLYAIRRFKTDPYMLPDARESTGEHCVRLADENKIRVVQTLPMNLHDSTAHTVEMMALLHDIDEESEEIVTFQTEIDPFFQEQMQERGYENFPRRIAKFWLTAALIGAADNQLLYLDDLLMESRSLIPEKLQTSALDTGEAIHTYQKLDALFTQAENGPLATMMRGKENIITAEMHYCMTLYDDIEMKRTLLGACVKLDEKRLGTQSHSECEFEKLKNPDHGRPLVGNSNTYYFMSQSSRFEPLVHGLVAKTKAEPHFAPFVAATIHQAYETQIHRASLKPFYFLDRPVDEPNYKAPQTTHDLWLTQARQNYKENTHGLKRPARILSSTDVVAEYKNAQKHLEKGNVMLPYRIKDGRKIPTDLLQRDGFDLVPLI